ncbi:MAG TPA: hypothetical protein VLE97_11095 [Gaiellaceae bacterium]|nr:hypothetical protein [Gaiellaceae bacterium]
MKTRARLDAEIAAALARRGHAAKLKSQCTFQRAFRRRFGDASFWQALHRGGKPGDWDWLERFFVDQIVSVAAPYVSFGLDYFHAEPSDEVLTIRARFFGEEQEPDTEVPAQLIHRELRDKLMELGAATKRKPELPLSVNWDIREVDLGYGRELHTVYEIHATFRLSDFRRESPDGCCTLRACVR